MPSLLKPQDWSVLGTHGLIQVNTTYVTAKKPVSSVLVRIAWLFAMLAAATVLIALPLTLLMPAWKATVAMVGLVLIYLGISFFVRPQSDDEKLGWQGRASELDSARLYRLLVALHWILAPGRFAAETLLDACALAGLARGAEVRDEAPAAASTPRDGLEPSAYSQASHDT